MPIAEILHLERRLLDISSKLFLCQSFEDLPDGVQVSDRTVVRHVLHIGNRLFQNKLPQENPQCRKTYSSLGESWHVSDDIFSIIQQFTCQL